MNDEIQGVAAGSPPRDVAEGFRFYYDRWEPGVVRLVTSFATEQPDVDDLLAVARAVAAQ